MIFQIDTPIDGTPFFDQRMTLDGEDYSIQLRWNVRRDVWTFDLLRLSDNVFIIQGQTLKVGRNLLRRKVVRPPGSLVCLTQDGTLTEPGLHDLGEGATHRLYYFDEEELAV